MAVDIIVGIVMISGCVLGWRVGFFREVFDKIGYVIGVLLSFLYTSRLANWVCIHSSVNVSLFILTFVIYIFVFLLFVNVFI